MIPPIGTLFALGFLIGLFSHKNIKKQIFLVCILILVLWFGATIDIAHARYLPFKSYYLTGIFANVFVSIVSFLLGIFVVDILFLFSKGFVKGAALSFKGLSKLSGKILKEEKKATKLESLEKKEIKKEKKDYKEVLKDLKTELDELKKHIASDEKKIEQDISELYKELVRTQHFLAESRNKIDRYLRILASLRYRLTGRFPKDFNLERILKELKRKAADSLEEIAHTFMKLTDHLKKVIRDFEKFDKANEKFIGDLEKLLGDTDNSITILNKIDADLIKILEEFEVLTKKETMEIINRIIQFEEMYKGKNMAPKAQEIYNAIVGLKNLSPHINHIQDVLNLAISRLKRSKIDVSHLETLKKHLEKIKTREKLVERLEKTVEKHEAAIKERAKELIASYLGTIDRARYPHEVLAGYWRGINNVNTLLQRTLEEFEKDVETIKSEFDKDYKAIITALENLENYFKKEFFDEKTIEYITETINRIDKTLEECEKRIHHLRSIAKGTVYERIIGQLEHIMENLTKHRKELDKLKRDSDKSLNYLKQVDIRKLKNAANKLRLELDKIAATVKSHADRYRLLFSGLINHIYSQIKILYGELINLEKELGLLARAIRLIKRK